MRMAFGAKNKTILVLTFSWFMLHTGAGAQEMAPLPVLPGVPQLSLENPAVQNQSGKLVIGIPLISGISGQWNTSIPINSLFSEGFSYSFPRFYNALGEQGQVRASAGISMFFASLEHNGYTFSLSVSEQSFSSGIFDREIVRFIRDGTMDFFGTNENLGSASFFFRHYREIAPGISKRVSENLDVGIRPKILFGKLNFEVQALNVMVETGSDGNELRLGTGGSFSLSGPFTHNRDSLNQFSSFAANISPGDYFFQPRNMGIALDAGVVFRPNRFSELSLSLVNAGLIGFKHNTYHAEFVRPILYSEFTSYQSHSPGEDRYREPREALRALGDSISYVIQVEKADKRIFFVLPFKINITGKYRVSEKITAGFSNQFKYYRQQPLNLFSAFAGISGQSKFDMYGSLTLFNISNISPGIGASYTAEWFQLFFATNNILGIFQPAPSKHLNLCLGINFLFETQ